MSAAGDSRSIKNIMKRPVTLHPSDCDIDPSVLLYGEVSIGEGTVIHPYTVIGNPVEEGGPIRIGKNSVIRSFSNIDNDVFIITSLLPQAMHGLFRALLARQISLYLKFPESVGQF